ncbi:MAG: GGDEF domain-containing protein [Pseudomonadota bacterium]
MRVTDWGERRHPCRWESESDDTGFWVPERTEIVTQFFTRYLFFSLAVIYFSTLESVRPVFFSIEQLLIALGGYFVVNSWYFHLALKRVTLLRIRSAMTADLIIVTLCVLHDPNPIPPSALAFLMVLLGNGMRYGMRLFAEVLVGSCLGMAIAFALRYRLGGFDVTAGDVFFGVFWVTLALYAYILMGRIEGQRRQLDYRSRFDALTGLLNRHGLVAAAEQVFDKTDISLPATVLFADLNQFKAVNDRYGHGAGDRVLAEFAQIFSESADMAVCGRWGGDEFVALLPMRDDTAVQQIFERIEARTEAWSQGNGLPMAVSLGVAHAPRDGHDLMTLLSVADIHLYRSKSLRPEADAPPIYRTFANESEAT